MQIIDVVKWLAIAFHHFKITLTKQPANKAARFCVLSFTNATLPP